MPLWSRKSIDSLLRDAENEEQGRPQLRRALGVWNLTSIGIGATLGAGIFVLSGTAAAQYAGPAVALSFGLAALACLCTALCYAELASMIPVSGSAYTYAYATLGEFVAWIIGWNLVLEYLISVSMVAVGWSGYFTALLDASGLHIPSVLTQPPLTWDAAGHWVGTGSIVNLPAVAITLAATMVLSMGLRESTFANNMMVLIKVTVVVLVIVCGAFFVDTSHWHPFLPQNTGKPGEFGWSGVMRAAGVVFFAYIGFDAVSTSAQEARNPRRTVPLSLLASLGICTVLYVGMSLVMTGLAPFGLLNVAHPVLVSIDHAGAPLAWLKPVVNVGAIVGLASAVFATLYGQVRIFYSMARDGMIPPAFAQLHARHRVPTMGTWLAGSAAALVAGAFPLEVLGELVSIGTLLAFAIVCTGVIVLRKTQPQRPRVFRAPFGIPVAVAGVIACVWLMISLPQETWTRLGLWLVAGFAIYFGYGYRRSKLRSEQP